MIVKNELNFIWYSLMSVIKHVDLIRVLDTGSTDGTLEVVKEMRKTLGRKMVFHKWDKDYYDEQEARQLMLDEVTSDWFIVVDGDEVWWDDSINKVTDEIKKSGDKLESIVVPTMNLVGDIFHYQEKEAGKYNLLGMKGHYNLRAVNRRIPGLKSLGQHGVWGWVDGEDRMIQDRDRNKIKFVDAAYLHATHLQRSGSVFGDVQVLKRRPKLKHELGISMPCDFYYPEVFFRPRPSIVPCIWRNMDFNFKFRAFFETPLREINRRYFKEKVGY